MKLHPRMALVSRARLDVDKALEDAIVEYDLTAVECVRILLALAEHKNTMALRFERHGTYDKKADEA